MSTVVAVDHRFADLDLERAVLEPRGVSVVDARRLETEAVLTLCEEADGILLGARMRFDVDLMKKLYRCRAIVRYGVGVDNVDLAAAEAAGIWSATSSVQ